MCRGFIAGCASKPVSRGCHAPGEKGHGEKHEGENENRLTLSDEQIAAAGIKLAAAEGGSIARLVTAPATIAADTDRLIHVTAKIAGTIAALRVKLGDQVAAGQVLAHDRKPRDRRGEKQLPGRSAGRGAGAHHL